MNTAQVYAALRTRFCAPEWAIFFEVSSATGAGLSSYADAVAMNLYPSRGLEINGFEVKVSRSDWLREKRDPAKAEPVFKYCDRWWLVIGSNDVAAVDEVPVSWGLMECIGSKLVIRRQAPALTPQAIDRPFFASLTRRASKIGDAEVKALVDQRVSDATKQLDSIERHRREQAEAALQTLREKVDAFEEAAGIRITNTWPRRSPKEIGEAVRFVLAGGMRSIDETLATMEQQATSIAERIREVRAANARETEPEPTGAPA